MKLAKKLIVTTTLFGMSLGGVIGSESRASEPDPGPHYFVTDEVNANQYFWREVQRFPGADIHNNFNLLAQVLGDRPVWPGGELPWGIPLVDPEVYRFSRSANVDIQIQPFAVTPDASRLAIGLPIGENLQDFLNDPLGDQTRFNLTLPFVDRNIGLSSRSAHMRVRDGPGSDSIWHSGIDFDYNHDTSITFEVVAPSDGVIENHFSDDKGQTRLTIRHTADNGTDFLTLYAHLDTQQVPLHVRRRGQRITRGEYLGRVLSVPGRDGGSYAHLHFGVAVRGDEGDVEGKHGPVRVPEAWYLIDPFGVYDYRRESNYLPDDTMNSRPLGSIHAQVFHSPNMAYAFLSNFKNTPDVCNQGPQLTGVAAGSILMPGSTELSWTSNGCHYWVYVGDAPDRNNYVNRSMAGATSVSASGYPSDGSDVYLTLLYRNTNIIDARWNRKHFRFSAPGS